MTSSSDVVVGPSPSLGATATTRTIPGWELVALVAGLMSLNALAIDVMLPALSAIGAELGLADANDRQFVVIGFAVGMGFGQLLFGPLSDRFGRKPVLLVAIIAYAIFGAGCNFASSFHMLVVLRVLQGVASAGARSTAVAVVRDRFQGAAMARTMSLVMTVFMVVPILAPSLGAAVLAVADWRAIFWLLVGFAAIMAFWSQTRLPETLAPEHRRAINPRSLLSAYGEVLRNPVCRGYTAAVGLVFGALMAFLGSSEQVFQHFGLVESFPLYFAGVAGVMAGANFLNARLVSSFGPRRVSHFGLLLFVAIQVAYLAVLSLGFHGFEVYYGFTGGTFLCLSMLGANFNSIAMEPMGHLAGTAAAALGFASTTIAAWLGGLIGQNYVDEPTPFAVGYLVLGLLALGCVLSAERGRLFGEG